jgi:hypothetical protein
MSNDETDIDALAAGPLDADDDQVLVAIAEYYAATDPIPPGLTERLQFAITLDALHAEVAELQRFGADAVGARSGQAPTKAQTVTFTSASLTTMITIAEADSGRVRIDGWAAPGAGVTVELRVKGRVYRTVADADGRFALADVDRGLAQFVLSPADRSAHPPVITPSLEL